MELLNEVKECLKLKTMKLNSLDSVFKIPGNWDAQRKSHAEWNQMLRVDIFLQKAKG